MSENRGARYPVGAAARGAGGVRRRTDRRVLRTRERLGDALIALMQEKPFESIAVQEVLDRAGVARSTFYLHYRDKQDLFLSDVDEFLAAMANLLARTGERSERVAPVRELFAHVAEARDLYAALAASAQMRDFMALAQGNFARAIGRRLGELARTRRLPARRRAALAQALAGGLLALLSWWIERGAEGSPAEMDDLFHRLAWGGVAGEQAPRGGD